MSLREDLELWRDRYRLLVQEGVVGPNDARQRVEVAGRHLERARRALAADDSDGALIWAEATIVSAADAILARDGLRLRGKTGSHEARFEYPGLPPAFVELRRRFAEMRRLRSRALYEAADVVPHALAVDTVEVAAALITSARQELDR